MAFVPEGFPGQFVSEYNVDAGQGGAFGLDAITDIDNRWNYAAVDDVSNSLPVYRLPGSGER
ncbi:MAG: hypothetical protein KGJ72_00555 [Gammaproteobacteria bacterium]|nr:hypothetical protein [Gammaproteobacteria bacterium]